MLRKNFFKILTAALFVVLFAFPALGAMNHKDFIELCKSVTAQQVRNAINAGADVNAKDNKGKTAINYAQEADNTEVVKVLKSAQKKVVKKRKR